MLSRLAGCCSFAASATWWHLPGPVSAGIAIAVTFTARTLSIVFNWKTASILPRPTDEKRQR